ncbi:hypothetical protein CgunFtcFv8_002270 [Champsocephalus gunnari]|uniref:Uncharacterized protein n=1 Tax=Champsocephalus gunnari TaxID=52237 RepID=A0AAN8CM86_CHAGU|nr:hypothetical protein CgunFtcFv8_002270 [Champsocephalus gunnari]
MLGAKYEDNPVRQTAKPPCQAQVSTSGCTQYELMPTHPFSSVPLTSATTNTAKVKVRLHVPGQQRVELTHPPGHRL